MLSIITPVLNGVSFIEENIESIKRLNIPFEHIIVDGGSTDGTLELIKQKFNHVTLIDQTIPGGMYAAIHEGFLKSKYDIITWINCDDQICHNNFREALEYMVKNNVDLIYGNGIFHWKNEQKFTNHKASIFAKFFLKRGILPFMQPSSIYRKDLYQQVKLNFNTYRICGDLDLFIRMAEVKNVKIKYIRKNLSVFLKYGASLGDLNYDRYFEERKILGRYPSFIVKLLFKITRMI